MDKKRMGIEELFSIEMPPQANYDLPDPDMLDYWNDYNQRIIFINSDIDDSIMKYVNNLYRWQYEDDKAGIKPEDRKPVTIFINSYGGDLNVCYSMISAMNAYSGVIKTVNYGTACSAAALIFINGTRGKRYCVDMSYALLHQGSGSTGMQTYEAQEAAQKNYRALINMMQENILKHTKIDQKTWNKIKAKENYYYPKDMISNGLCDKIITNISEIWK